MRAQIAAVAYHLPERVLTNEELAALFPEWTAPKIEQKLGIAERHIAADDECASDLAVRAAERLFQTGACKPVDIDALLLCTQSADYFLPTTACVLQERLGLSRQTAALDFNLGCSGYVYGLGLAKGLIESGQACKVLLLTAETYSKFMHPRDKSVRTLFGDGASATLVCAASMEEALGPFVYGTDGRGAGNLIVPAGGMRRRVPEGREVVDENGSVRTDGHLFMNGPEIFAFTLQVVEQAVRRLAQQSGQTLEQVDKFVFHQANKYMLDHLRRKIGIPEDRFLVSMRHCGNTVSSSIPIALCDAAHDGRIRAGDRLMLVGFGVGYSWGACMTRWAGACVSSPSATIAYPGHGESFKSGMAVVQG